MSDQTGGAVARYTVNDDPGGQSVIHQDHPWEVCNVDDAAGVRKVEQDECASMLAEGRARPCGHCMADSWLKNAFGQ